MLLSPVLGPVLRSRFERGCVELNFHLLLGIFGLHISDKVNYTNGISEFVVIPRNNLKRMENVKQNEKRATLNKMKRELFQTLFFYYYLS